MKGSSGGWSTTVGGTTKPTPPFWSICGDTFDVSYDFPREFCGGAPASPMLSRSSGQSYTGLRGRTD